MMTTATVTFGPLDSAIDDLLSGETSYAAVAPHVLRGAQAISAVRDRDAVIRDFHLISYNSSVWANSRWLGIPTEQNPNDVWVTQEIIFDVRPDYFMEAGTFKGGSAALWATILAHVNPQGRVITIDVKDQAEEARRLPVVKDKVDFLLGTPISWQKSRAGCRARRS